MKHRGTSWVFIILIILLATSCADPKAVIDANLEIVEWEERSLGNIEVKVQIAIKETYGACGAKGIAIVSRWLSAAGSVYEFSHLMGNVGSSGEKEKFFIESIDAKLAMQPDIVKIKIKKHTCSDPVQFATPKFN